MQIDRPVNHIAKHSSTKRIQTKASNLNAEWKQILGDTKYDEQYIPAKARTLPESSNSHDHEHWQNKKYLIKQKYI